MKKFILAFLFCLISGIAFAGTITEKTIVGKIEVLPDGVIQVREDRIVYEDGVEICRTYKRHVIDPGNDISKEDAKVQSIANIVQTKTVVDAYIAEHNKK